jgi:hypothetical protein
MEDERRYPNVAVWVIRIAALLLAMALLRWGSQLQTGYLRQSAATFSYDWGRFWRIQAVFLLAGIVFVAALRFPFPRPRFAWGFLLVAGIVLLPVVHYWSVFASTSSPSVVRRFYWFDSVSLDTWSTLAGVAIGAAFGARAGSRRETQGEHEA